MYEKLSARNVSKITFNDRKMLLESIVKMECYRNGYRKPALSWKSFQTILYTYQNAISKGTNMSTMFSSRVGKNRKSYIDDLQSRFPTFLHKLYRYAIDVLGFNATVPQITHVMMQKAKIDFPHCPFRSNLHLTTYKFWMFF